MSLAGNPNAQQQRQQHQLYFNGGVGLTSKLRDNSRDEATLLEVSVGFVILPILIVLMQPGKFAVIDVTDVCY